MKDIKYTPPRDEEDADNPPGEGKAKHNFGVSSLFGRTEQNVTFHQRGAYDEAKFDNAFPKAYLDILKSALRMASLFFRSK